MASYNDVPKASWELAQHKKLGECYHIKDVPKDKFRTVLEKLRELGFADKDEGQTFTYHGSPGAPNYGEDTRSDFWIQKSKTQEDAIEALMLFSGLTGVEFG